jgi:hypothetical protein
VQTIQVACWQRQSVFIPYYPGESFNSSVRSSKRACCQTAACSIANATLPGLSAFATTTAILSCLNAGLLIPSTGFTVFPGLALVYGAISQVPQLSMPRATHLPRSCQLTFAACCQTPTRAGKAAACAMRQGCVLRHAVSASPCPFPVGRSELAEIAGI